MGHRVATAVDALVRFGGGWFMRRQVRRHLLSVSGWEHLPVEGPFVLVPNHRSYFDHWIVAVVVASVTGRRVWFLTKQEAFARLVPRLWTRAWHGIPVDRDVPTPDTLRAVRRVFVAGDALCVYPEGTRNTTESMLPFRSGAFRFALLGAAPVVPVAIRGSETVLDRGDRWFRRRGRAEIAFGPAIEPDPSADKRAAASALADRTRGRIERLLDQGVSGDGSPGDGVGAASTARTPVAPLLERRITEALAPDGSLDPGAERRLRSTARLLASFAAGPSDAADVAVQRARLLGILSVARSPRVRLAGVLRVRVVLHAVLRRDPTHQHANYLLGRWHLAVPRFLGGSPARGAAAFDRSIRAASPTDTRPLLGSADALLAQGAVTAATDALERVLRVAVEPGSRAAARAERARRRLVDLRVEYSVHGARPRGADHHRRHPRHH